MRSAKDKATKARGATVHGAANFCHVRWHTTGNDRIAPMPLPAWNVKTKTVDIAPPGPAVCCEEDQQAQPACYVCLEESGEMLVNVCACRWSRVHVKCLERVQKTSKDNMCGEYYCIHSHHATSVCVRAHGCDLTLEAVSLLR